MPQASYPILLFGPAATAAGKGSVRVRVDGGSDCAAVLAALCLQHPEVEPIARGGRLAVNGAYVDDSTVIGPDDELALVALVSGG